MCPRIPTAIAQDNPKLQRSAHRSVKALAADINAWVETWNENPKPFVWTKTADQILNGYSSSSS